MPGDPTAHRPYTYRCFLPDLAGFGTVLLRGTWHLAGHGESNPNDNNLYCPNGRTI